MKYFDCLDRNRLVRDLPPASMLRKPQLREAKTGNAWPSEFKYLVDPRSIHVWGEACGWIAPTCQDWSLREGPQLLADDVVREGAVQGVSCNVRQECGRIRNDGE